MAKIIVKNNDWDGARAKLESSLQAQNTDFSAKLKAAFAPAAASNPAVPTTPTPQAAARNATASKAPYGGLPRSRVSR